jgi:hypothetical protein
MSTKTLHIKLLIFFRTYLALLASRADHSILLKRTAWTVGKQNPNFIILPCMMFKKPIMLDNLFLTYSLFIK